MLLINLLQYTDKVQFLKKNQKTGNNLRELLMHYS